MGFPSSYSQEFASHGPQQSLLGSVVQWLSSSSTRPSLIDASSSPEFPWFGWAGPTLRGEVGGTGSKDMAQSAEGSHQQTKCYSGSGTSGELYEPR